MDTLHEQPIPTEIDAQTGMPIGPKVVNPSPSALPLREALDGRYCRLEPLNAEQHGAELFAASTPSDSASRFMYLGEEPPTSESDLKRWAESASQVMTLYSLSSSTSEPGELLVVSRSFA